MPRFDRSAGFQCYSLLGVPWLLPFLCSSRARIKKKKKTINDVTTTTMMRQ